MSQGKPREERDVETRPLVPTGARGRPLVLLVVDPDGVRAHPLPAAGRVVLGRLEGSDVRLADPSISRRHAALEVGAVLKLQDLGSANGVSVRGVRLAPHETVEITPGDAIALGALLVVVQPAPAPSAPRAGASTAPGAPPSASGARNVVVRDPAMQKLFELVGRAGPSAISVLLLGETGVGKEVFAAELHAAARADRPFLRLNCAALSESLLESELFGHEKGAFTGATQAKPGLLEMAAGGTVFLDEVGELSPRLQAKLLRVLEERSALRVGGLRPRPVDGRFVAATNRDLRAEVDRGTFRRDLYFRLNGVTIEIPPLRARVVEIAPLAELFLAAAGEPPPVLSPAARAALERYAWPGNVRELRHAMDRALLLCGAGPILPEHLPPDVLADARAPVASPPPSPLAAAPVASDAPPAAPRPLRSEREEFERRRVLEALERCHGNQTRAAEVLGLSRRALVARLAAYGVPRPRKG